MTEKCVYLPLFNITVDSVVGETQVEAISLNIIEENQGIMLAYTDNVIILSKEKPKEMLDKQFRNH